MILVWPVHQGCLSVIPTKVGIQARVFHADGSPPTTARMTRLPTTAGMTMDPPITVGMT